MIIEEKEKYEVYFEDLKAGDVFCFNETYYMKVEEDYGDDIDAVELKNGICVEFCPDDKVTKVNAKLVIE